MACNTSIYIYIIYTCGSFFAKGKTKERERERKKEPEGNKKQSSQRGVDSKLYTLNRMAKSSLSAIVSFQKPLNFGPAILYFATYKTCRLNSYHIKREKKTLHGTKWFQFSRTVFLTCKYDTIVLNLFIYFFF